MVNQIATYHPYIARHTGILQGLLKKNVAFTWMEEQQMAFSKLKNEVMMTLALNHFDASWNTQLITVASRLHA